LFGDDVIDSTLEALTTPVHHENLARAWTSMRHRGYLVARDQLLGVTPGFRQRFHRRYFTEGILRRCPGDVPADRERARDVLRYEWQTRGQVALVSHDVTAIKGRHELREFPRVRLAHEAEFAAWAAAILSLVPPERRLPRGTFGINLFRTRTQVVTAPHQEHEEFIVVYVLDKIGEGAKTSLYDVHNPGTVVEHATLRPGDFVIFDDARFKHSATPLVAAIGSETRRDALVCTVDSPGTYPLG
jgi:hypothetical protein